jgi:purine-binding chemotaxis protein CheW
MKGQPQPVAGGVAGRVAGRVDWADVHRRLDLVRDIVERQSVRGPEETKRILKQRAQVLARPPIADDGLAQHLDVVEFVLARESYGLESAYVREIHPLSDLTPLPCVPDFVAGIVNVRGEIVSVIDIKRFFGLARRGLTDLNKVIVLHSQAMTFGILADAIVGVRSVAAVDLQPPPPTLSGVRQEFLLGVTVDRLVVLDARKLLEDRNMIVHEEVPG